MKTLHFQNVVRGPDAAKGAFPISVELDVEKKIQAEAYKHRIRVKEFFRDYDKLRKGVVTEAAFKTSIATLNVNLSEFELKQLLEKYRTPEGLVNYKNFCENIDRAFFEQDTAKDALEKHHSKPNLTREEQELLDKVKAQIRKIVKDHTILMKPHFAAFDKTKRSHITVGQFSRVLKQLNLLPEEKSFDLLARAYADLNTLHDINYVRFCEDIDTKSEVKMGEVPLNTPECFTKPMVTKIDTNEFKDMDALKPRFLEPSINMQADPDDIVERIQAVTVMKRVRVTEFFYDFDKLRKGVVTKDQFRRILSMLGYGLTDPEYEALERKYIDKNGFMSYAKFCNDIDSVFTIKGIDKDPTVAVKPLDVSNTLKARRKRIELDEGSKKKLFDILTVASKLVLTQRFHMKPFFQAFDTTQCGFITKSQFARVLAQVGLKPSEETMNILLKYYMNKGNLDEVNYFDFVNDVDRPEDIYLIEEKDVSLKTVKTLLEKQEEKKKAKAEIVHRNPEDLEDTLALIRKKVKQERIRLAEFLRDFDKLRSGSITNAQFRLGLKMGKVELSNAEFELICEHFASDIPGKIRWRDFVDKIEEVFTLKGLEQKPTLKVEGAKTETKYGFQPPSEKDSQICALVTEKFSQFLVRENLDIKSFFQEWDRHRHFKVSPKQFRQVLASCKFSLTNEEFAAVVAHYKDPATGDIFYMKFLHDAAPYKYPLESQKATYTATGFAGTSGSPSQTQSKTPRLDTVMTRIKNVVKQKRIRVEEFFLDHDPLRKGDVSSAKFRSCLDGLKMDLKAEDFVVLEAGFPSERDASRIDYVKFSYEVNKIFTLKELEKDPTRRVENFLVSSVLDPDDVLTPEEETKVDGCLRRLGDIVQKRKLHVKPMFQAKDIAKSGIVMNTRFRAILDFHKIALSDEEYELLCKRFMAKAKNEVNYVDFDNLLRKYSGDIEEATGGIIA